MAWCDDSAEDAGVLLYCRGGFGVSIDIVLVFGVALFLTVAPSNYSGEILQEKSAYLG